MYLSWLIIRVVIVDKYNQESAQVYWESIFQETNPIWTQTLIVIRIPQLLFIK